MDDNDYQLSKFQLFIVVISNKYKFLKFCPLVLDATVYEVVYSYSQLWEFVFFVFFTIHLNGIIAITNSSENIESLW